MPVINLIAVPNTDENANETKDEKPKRKKTKTMVTMVRKSRLERQISNAQHVLDKYVPGKTLGKSVMLT